ncbi:tRNA-dependent cyclodipeptide synthase [Streptomyces sp. NPDC090445]|uniref:tRNA-dependent cyclodipeptide synthase n=1 Tax=Streptomyces sp. NPDC090445 TaxID=3365963 RepID=UPI00380A54F2
MRAPVCGVRVRALSEFQSHPVHRLPHRRVLHFPETDDEFRKGCEETALHFVGSELPEGESITADRLQVCFGYLVLVLLEGADGEGAAASREAVRAPGAPCGAVRCGGVRWGGL